MLDINLVTAPNHHTAVLDAAHVGDIHGALGTIYQGDHRPRPTWQSKLKTLADVLLPAATVFLLLLCNDAAVLGPWVNGKWTNLFTGSVIAILVMLSVALTASVLYPSITGEEILMILGGGTVLALIAAVVTLAMRGPSATLAPDVSLRPAWRMRPLTQLLPARLTGATRVWMIVLRGYLLLAVGMVVVKVIQLAAGL
jgi:hypothetical protein